jgi:DNA invertase Pin-like site-specific DNA recombinase
MTDAHAVRCAIYTRKSSDEGLEQSFNSLHAQRESCEAYVKSQVGEGWTLGRDRYDDGGYSGGEMDRPGLRRLLADVAARRLDVVVVYKVDRLTRSLRDFAKIIETFDTAGVSFVSVTQAFNTTTSMGRLTLNVLLSFAQFEREVTCERIRDKIAASKAKGMWMGGQLPLGYDAPTNRDSRALVVNEAEARTVRLIFQRYLELGNSLALQRWLAMEGVRSKPRTSVARRFAGGHEFSRGALFHLLKNRTYLGEIPHKGESYPGRHPAIIDQQTFDATQALLARNSQTRRERVPGSARALLRGILFDADGQPMEPVIFRARRLYQYYASRPLWSFGRDGEEDDAIRRVPSEAIDGLVMRRLAPIAGVVDAELDRLEVRALLERVEIHAAAVHLIVRVAALAGRSRRRVTVDGVRRQLLPGEQVTAEAHDSRLIRIRLPVRLKVRGGRTWNIDANGRANGLTSAPDRLLIERVRAAHAILRTCGAQPDASDTQMRYARAPHSSQQMKLARWAFLAPDVQKAILEGRRMGAGDAVKSAKIKIPLLWSEQRSMFGAKQPNQELTDGSLPESGWTLRLSKRPTEHLAPSP